MLTSIGRTVFEAILVVTLVMSLLMGVFSYTQKAIRITKEHALISELSNIRASISLYYVLNKRFPVSIKQLTEERIIIPFRGDTIINSVYLEKMSLNENGEVLDPFGNTYGYDPKTGKVKTLTPNYAAW